MFLWQLASGGGTKTEYQTRKEGDSVSLLCCRASGERTSSNSAVE